MNKTVKILITILTIALLATVVMPNMVMAASDDSSSVVTSIFNNGGGNTDGIINIGANIVSIITTVGIVVAVVVLLILGIKYMMGSASEKAEYKKTMIPYLVGAVLIFGASAIARAVISMSEGLTSTGA